MSTAQFTLTVNDGKWIIAKAIASMPIVKEALENAKVVFKAGTTVSCVANEIAGENLRICGRITKRGHVSAKTACEGAHVLLLEKGVCTNEDSHIPEFFEELNSHDVIIIGANIIDIYGNAAMLAGSPGGGNCGRSTALLGTEGAHVIVAAGLEKLFPGNVMDSIKKARRKDVDYSMGMSCGLFPIIGEVITELEALRLLGDVEVTIIARGGIDGAEGSASFQIEGEESQVVKVLNIVNSVKGKTVSGTEDSLKECSFPAVGCGKDLGCVYSKKNKLKI